MIPPDIALSVEDFDEEEKEYWEAAIGFDLPVTSIDFGFDFDSVVENEDESVDWKGIFDLVDCWKTLDNEWTNILISCKTKILFRNIVFL